MNLRGAIFDVDGTLLDSMSVWDTVGEDYLRSFGIEPKRNFQETVKAMSLYQAARHMQKAYELSLSTAEITAGINGRIEDFYRHDAPLKPGASELLAQLSRRSVKMCLATATDRHLIEAALSRLGVLSYFTEIFTCASVGRTSRIFLKPLFVAWARKKRKPSCLKTRSTPSAPQRPRAFLSPLSAIRTKTDRRRSESWPTIT